MMATNILANGLRMNAKERDFFKCQIMASYKDILKRVNSMDPLIKC